MDFGDGDDNCDEGEFREEIIEEAILTTATLMYPTTATQNPNLSYYVWILKAPV